jgi:hypothetical protein
MSGIKAAFNVQLHYWLDISMRSHSLPALGTLLAQLESMFVVLTKNCDDGVPE